jgi:hypothetical protein
MNHGPESMRFSMTTERIDRDTLHAANSVAAYRDAIRRGEATAGQSAKHEWQRVARHLRQRWKEYNGDDDLHELAFGEPPE